MQELQDNKKDRKYPESCPICPEVRWGLKEHTVDYVSGVYDQSCNEESNRE